MHDITYHTFIHENMRKRFMEGFHYDAHPMGMLVSAVAALSTFYPDAKEIDDPDDPPQADRPAHRQDADARRRAAHRFSVGMPFVYPDNSLELRRQLPVDDVRAARATYRAHDPVLAQALDVLFILHADHEQNCSHHRHARRRLVARRPLHRRAPRPPPRSTARATAAPTRQVIRMLTEIGSIDNVADFVKSGEGGQGGRLQGFGHRVYKNYDPRATIIKQTADEVFAVTGKNPLLDIALKLEEVALSDEYFISRKLYPNVDFYSGLIYQAMGFPIEMFTVLFAIPRTSGWLAHWEELLEQDAKIARPRQLYIGEEARDYVPLADR